MGVAPQEGLEGRGERRPAAVGKGAWVLGSQGAGPGTPPGGPCVRGWSGRGAGAQGPGCVPFLGRRQKARPRHQGSRAGELGSGRVRGSF